jgi:hypothetical protein
MQSAAQNVLEVLCEGLERRYVLDQGRQQASGIIRASGISRTASISRAAGIRHQASAGLESRTWSGESRASLILPQPWVCLASAAVHGPSTPASWSHGPRFLAQAATLRAKSMTTSMWSVDTQVTYGKATGQQVI